MRRRGFVLRGIRGLITRGIGGMQPSFRKILGSGELEVRARAKCVKALFHVVTIYVYDEINDVFIFLARVTWQGNCLNSSRHYPHLVQS